MLQALCNVVKSAPLFEDYHYHFKMYNNHILELNI